MKMGLITDQKIVDFVVPSKMINGESGIARALSFREMSTPRFQKGIFVLYIEFKRFLSRPL